MTHKEAVAMAAGVAAIRQAYTRLWTAFTDAAGAQGLRAESTAKVGAVVSRSDKGVTTAHALLLMPSWPFKVVSNKKSVDIVVRTTETFSEDLTRIVSATTCVGYFEREDDTCRPLLELHYDFVTPVQEAHPLFHAQLGSTDWPVDKLRELGFPKSISRKDSHSGYANARIPTAFMGYAPILVSLAADHLKPQNFRSMIAEARKPVGLCDPSCKRMSDSLHPVAVPHAHHWYDERYVMYEWAEKKLTKAAIPVLGESFLEKDSNSVRARVIEKLHVPLKQLEIRTGPPPA